MCARIASARADQSSYKTRSVVLPAVKSRRQNMVFLLPAASLHGSLRGDPGKKS